MPGSTTNAAVTRETALRSAATSAAEPEPIVTGTAETVAAGVVSAVSDADLAARVRRASALAHLNAPVQAPATPVVDAVQENTQRIVMSGAVQEIPVLPKPAGFSGITHRWWPDGEPYRVIELSFPMLVPSIGPDGKPTKLYSIANYGDVVFLDAEAAVFGLKHKSVELIPE